MTGKPLLIAAGILGIMTVTALVTYLLTKHDLENRRPAAATPTSAAEVADSESEIIREMLLVKSVVERYIRAVAAKDETAAARFTCRKTPGLLWVGSVGRPITVLRVTGINLVTAEVPTARVEIQVEGKPQSALNLTKIDGAWCVVP